MKVLVLDNDRTMRDLLAYALRGRGLSPVVAEGLEEAERALADVDGLLLDFQLGEGQTGAAVARRWAEEERLPPFWLVTGMPEDPEVQGLRELGELQKVVGKPFSLLELVEGVEDTLRKLAQLDGAAPDSTYAYTEAWDRFELGPEQETDILPQVPEEEDVRTDMHHASGPDSVE